MLLQPFTDSQVRVVLISMIPHHYNGGGFLAAGIYVFPFG